MISDDSAPDRGKPTTLDGAEMLGVAHALRLHAVADCRHCAEGDLVRVLGGEDVEVAEIGQLRALRWPQPRQHG